MTTGVVSGPGCSGECVAPVSCANAFRVVSLPSSWVWRCVCPVFGCSFVMLAVLWIIYFVFCANVMAGLSVHDAMTVEATDFSFQTSLFDLVLLATGLHIAFVLSQRATRHTRLHHSPDTTKQATAHGPVRAQCCAACRSFCWCAECANPCWSWLPAVALTL